MPIYVYQKLDGQLCEFLQKMDDPPYHVHPQTGEKISKIIGLAAIHRTGLKKSAKVNKECAGSTPCQHPHQH